MSATRDVIDTFGTRRLGMENVPAFIARGILIDVAGHLGHDILPAGYAIQPDEIDAAAREAQGGTEVRQGDVVLHPHRMGQALGRPGDAALRRAGPRQGLRRAGPTPTTS